MSNTEAFFSRPLAESDPDIFGAIEKELGRQRHEIELIASENRVMIPDASAPFALDLRLRLRLGRLGCEHVAS